MEIVESKEVVKEFKEQEPTKHDYELHKYIVKHNGKKGKVVICWEITDVDEVGNKYITDYVEYADDCFDKEEIKEIEQFLTN